MPHNKIHPMKMNNTNNVKGKNVLLLCDEFHGYNKKIKEALLQLGANEVYSYNSKFICSFRTRREIKTFRGFVKWLIFPWRRSLWTYQFKRQIKNKKIDTFLCISFPVFKKSFISWLRKNNPDIKIILFLWDNIDELKVYYSDYYKKFDKAYSFDRNDAKKYGLIYHPDFYLPFDRREEDLVYDLSFIGSFCGLSRADNRGEILKKIQTICYQKRLKSYLFLRFSDTDTSGDNRLISKIKRFTNKDTKSEHAKVQYSKEPFYKEYSLTLEEVEDIQRKSKAIVDINHIDRQGLTINAITAIAMGKKLITTNARINEEQFYDPNMILIIDENNIENIDIPKEFFEKKNIPIDISYLRLDNWLKKIIE